MAVEPSTPSKRLCVFADGTWNSPELKILTNIATLARSLAYKCSEGIPQVCFYDPGVGTDGGAVNRVRGGAFGVGIDQNIQQLYTFLAMNYDEGDEIYMFGFSRGAYTVRSLAGMMNESGLLYREHLDYVREAYDLYRDNEDLDSPTAVNFRNKYSRRVPVKLLLCFDTVGALGLPDSLPFPLSVLGDDYRYQFHNTELSDPIENAIHVVSIDEDRKSFSPTLMKPNSRRGPKQLTEVFMPGSHSGVGGGTEEELNLTRNALLFALEEMKKRNLGIEFSGDLLPKQYSYDIPPLPQQGYFGYYNMFRLLTGGEKCRDIASVDQLHETAIRRFKTFGNWRPKGLIPLKNALTKLADSL